MHTNGPDKGVNTHSQGTNVKKISLLWLSCHQWRDKISKKQWLKKPRNGKQNSRKCNYENVFDRDHLYNAFPQWRIFSICFAVISFLTPACLKLFSQVEFAFERGKKSCCSKARSLPVLKITFIQLNKSTETKLDFSSSRSSSVEMAVYSSFAMTSHLDL